MPLPRQPRPPGSCTAEAAEAIMGHGSPPLGYGYSRSTEYSMGYTRFMCTQHVSWLIALGPTPLYSTMGRRRHMGLHAPASFCDVHSDTEEGNWGSGKKLVDYWIGPSAERIPEPIKATGNFSPHSEKDRSRSAVNDFYSFFFFENFNEMVLKSC